MHQIYVRIVAGLALYAVLEEFTSIAQTHNAKMER